MHHAWPKLHDPINSYVNLAVFKAAPIFPALHSLTPFATPSLFVHYPTSSYVNLAVFKADTDRGRVSELVGPECEALIYRFCTIDRHDLIYTQLLDKVGL